jgi:quercetin dioxygenase-like cupin family protein
MTEGRVYSTASWDRLADYPLEQLPQDHPWPARENLTLRDYFEPLGCSHLAFSIGRLAPGQSVEHHRHKEAEEVYLLLRGSGQIRINEEVVDAKPLDAFRIPPDAYRSVYNNSTEECWWLFMGAPVTEFLEEREGASHS